MKHTPGPWKIRETKKEVPQSHRNNFKNETRYEFGIESGSDVTHARVFELGLVPESVARANANLIAAAPDLLEALIECQKIVLSWQHGAIGYDEHGRNAMRDAVEMADMAIQKTKGKK